MYKIRSMITGLFLAVICQSCVVKKEILRLYQVDPLKKVLKEQTYFRDQVDTICVAKGEYASIQLVAKGMSDVKEMRASVKEVKSADGDLLRGVTAGWVGYVYVGRSYDPPSTLILRAPSDYFPDPILTDSAFCIESGEVQPLWITVPIDHHAKPGLYKGVVEITGLVNNKKARWEKDFFLRIYPVQLGKSPLFITNWLAHHSPRSLSYLNNNEAVALYSPLYWEFIEMYAEIMSSHRQNVHRIYPVWHTQYTLKEGKYTFDFSRFEKEVAIFDHVNALELINGGHLAWRCGDWNSPFCVEVPITDNEESRGLTPGKNPLKEENGIRFVLLPIEDLRTQNFLSQFLPAFKEYLEKKGWLEKYTQFIADEPTTKNTASYKAISQYVRTYMPDVRLLDAVMTSKELDGAIDIWIPALNVLHNDYAFYQEQQKKGKEVWYYTCLAPKGNYANRFIEQPLIQTRYLHWINYQYNITGYLHWGLNSWMKDPLNADSSRDNGKLPAGDNCIIYPGYRKLYSSIRFEVMREGIDDYQLLKLLEAKNPTKARELSSSIIQNFNQYDGSIRFFRNVRKQLLEALSQ